MKTLQEQEKAPEGSLRQTAVFLRSEQDKWRQSSSGHKQWAAVWSSPRPGQDPVHMVLPRKVLSTA